MSLDTDRNNWKIFNEQILWVLPKVQNKFFWFVSIVNIIWVDLLLMIDFSKERNYINAEICIWSNMGIQKFKASPHYYNWYADKIISSS